MAGGGIKGGKVIGATDEIGLRAIQDPVHVHDLHASVLAMLGLDHEKLTFPFQGRDFQLTDVQGRTVNRNPARRSYTDASGYYVCLEGVVDWRRNSAYADSSISPEARASTVWVDTSLVAMKSYPLSSRKIMPAKKPVRLFPSTNG